METVNIAQKFAHITEYWKPYIAAELNGQHVKLDKLKGEFVFHHHENEDELFLVVKGRFRMDFRDRQVWLEEGEFIVVPRGVEHKPVAEEECWILLFEPASTLNTGNVVNERTLHELERVRAVRAMRGPATDENRALAMGVRALGRILLRRRRGLDHFDLKIHGQLFRRKARSFVACLIP